MTNRELDALVAEKVMGLGVMRWINHPEHEPVLSRTRLPQPVLSRTGLPLPNYSTNISDAWQVVEKIQEDNPGWRFALLGGDTTQLFKLPSGNEMGGFFGWKAEFFGHEDPEQDFGQRHGEAYDETAPLAIVKAALEALNDS